MAWTRSSGDVIQTDSENTKARADHRPEPRSRGRPVAPTVSSRNTRRLVFLALALQASQTVALVAATIVTGSSALAAQTFVAAADLAVQVFLVIDIRTSAREPDATHPVGYGRERYFWSLYAARLSLDTNR
jgi:Co/Zn/Cd efflux system component